jgi:outer membrane protein OmpA-like peptidoglycan-associated protein
VRARFLLGSFLALFPRIAAAQTDVDAERFKPAVTHDGWVNAEGSAVRPTADPWEFGAFLNYARNPLVVVNGAGDVSRRLVSGHAGLDLFASVTLAKPFAVGLGLPLYVIQTGDYDPSFGGLGDLRLVPKIRILDDRESIGLAFAAELRAPTHTGDYNGGARNVTFIPKAILDHRFPSGVHIGFNLGAVVREKTTLFNVSAGSEFAYAGALGYRFGGYDGKTELGLELDGGVGFTQTDTEELPLEGFLFLRHNPDEEWEIIGGPGIGMISGYGVPTFRIFAGIRYTPTAHDADGDGIADDEDQCPQVAEDHDGDTDYDGCPEEDPDDDHDGVPNKSDECPSAKETINGVQDDDGCPDTGDPRVIYENGKIQVLDNVQFEHGSAEIKQESNSLLDQVALHMKANPEIKRVRIEGHTDDTGPRDVNVRLSKQRAEAVRQHLVKKGVNPQRLTAEGYGPDRPLVKDTTDEARAKNRRVEFVVEQ